MNMKRLITIGTVLLMASPAFAAIGEVSRAQSQQENRITTAATRIEGIIAINNGNLTISDSKTGRKYRLTNADGVKKLFDEGNRNVAVEGTLADADTIQVSTAEKNN
jgi:hypothetical protein